MKHCGNSFNNSRVIIIGESQKIGGHSKKLEKEAKRVAPAGGYVVTKKWITSFRQRHRIALQRAQRHTTMTDEEREARLNKFLMYVYIRGGGVSAKCEVMPFCLKLATSKKGGGFTPFARN